MSSSERYGKALPVIDDLQIAECQFTLMPCVQDQVDRIASLTDAQLELLEDVGP